MKQVTPKASIILAYGFRWNRSHLRLLPRFQNIPSIGVYFLYNELGEVVPFYVGEAVDIKRRLLKDHAKGNLSDKWKAFSWFIIDERFAQTDVEALIIRSCCPENIESRTPTNTGAFTWNNSESGFKSEKNTFRNYWVKENSQGKSELWAVDEESRSILAPYYQAICRVKRNSRRT